MVTEEVTSAVVDEPPSYKYVKQVNERRPGRWSRSSPTFTSREHKDSIRVLNVIMMPHGAEVLSRTGTREMEARELRKRSVTDN